MSAEQPQWQSNVMMQGQAQQQPDSEPMTIDLAMALISYNANAHLDCEPTLGTLLEEVGELARALEGKHEDHPGMELVQIGGIVVNMLRRYDWTTVINAINVREQRKAAQEAS